MVQSFTSVVADLQQEINKSQLEYVPKFVMTSDQDFY